MLNSLRRSTTVTPKKWAPASWFLVQLVGQLRHHRPLYIYREVCGATYVKSSQIQTSRRIIYVSGEKIIAYYFYALYYFSRVDQFDAELSELFL